MMNHDDLNELIGFVPSSWPRFVRALCSTLECEISDRFNTWRSLYLRIVTLVHLHRSKPFYKGYALTYGKTWPSPC